MTDELPKPFVIKSWMPNQFVDLQWSGNKLRFKTETEASAYAHGVWTTWKASVAYRVVPTREPPNATFADGELAMLPEADS